MEGWAVCPVECATEGDVAGLMREMLDGGCDAQALCDFSNEFAEWNGPGIPQIQYLESLQRVHRRDDSLGDVVDECVVPGGTAIPVLLNAFTSEHPRDEFVDGHFRSLPGAVHREETEATDVEAVEVRVGMGEELAGLLGGRIGADRG